MRSSAQRLQEERSLSSIVGRALEVHLPILAAWALLVVPATNAESASPPDKAAILRELVAGNFVQAELLARERWRASQQAHGDHSVEAALALDDVVEALIRQGRFGEPDTNRLAYRSLEDKRRAGARPGQLCLSVGNLALIASFAGQLQRANEIAELAEPLLEAEPGKDSVALAITLLNVSNLLLGSQDYKRSLGFSEAALRHAEPELGLSALSRTKIHVNRGVALWGLLRFDEGRDALSRSLQIQEGIAAGEPAARATATIGLAALEDDAGNVERSLELYQRGIRELEVVDRQHPDLLQAHCSSALVRALAGDKSGAFEALDRAFEIIGADTDRSAARAFCLAVRGTQRLEVDDLTDAQLDLERAVEIRREVYGSTHARTLETEKTLAQVRCLQAGTLESYQRFLAAVDRYAAAQGISPLGSSIWKEASKVSLDRNDFDRATTFARRAASIAERSVGRAHRKWGEAAARIAEIELHAGRWESAVDWAKAADENGRNLLTNVLAGLPESAALRLARARPSGLDTIFSVLHAAPRPAPALVSEAWTMLAKARGIVSEELFRRARRRRAIHQPSGENVYSQLERNQQRLAELKISALDEADPKTIRNRFRELESEELTLLNRLRSGPGSDEPGRGRNVLSIGRELGRLQPTTAVAAFVRYREVKSNEDQYAVLWARGGQSSPRFLPLGKADTIDPLIERWRNSLLPDRAGLQLPTENENRRAGDAVRNAIWDPWRKQIAGATHLYLIAESAVHHVMFEALPDQDGAYLAEHTPPITYLNSERDLLHQSLSPGNGGVLAMGSIDYGPHHSQLAAQDDKTWSFWSWIGLKGGSHRCANPIDEGFMPLSGTDLELRQIEELVSAGGHSFHALSGRDATKAALREAVRGKRAVHFSTHGFIADPDCPDNAKSPTLDTLPNPLHLAGIALSGANQVNSGESAAQGLLLADEVSALDLSAAEWVTLSACDTGSGPVAQHEGLLSLRRAFTQAGARVVISSLWPVDTKTAAEWMIQFYRERLTSGITSTIAARRAQLVLLETRRNTGQSTHPFWWAGFIVAGRE